MVGIIDVGQGIIVVENSDYIPNPMCDLQRLAIPLPSVFHRQDDSWKLIVVSVS